MKPLFRIARRAYRQRHPDPEAMLILLNSNGIAGAAETGFYFNANGTINFAPGQTFPGGTGRGPITGVTAALTGRGSSANVTLNLDFNKGPLLLINKNFTGNQIINED